MKGLERVWKRRVGLGRERLIERKNNDCFAVYYYYYYYYYYRWLFSCRATKSCIDCKVLKGHCILLSHFATAICKGTNCSGSVVVVYRNRATSENSTDFHCVYTRERYRGYYTAARRYEFYFRVVKYWFYHEWNGEHSVFLCDHW